MHEPEGDPLTWRKIVSDLEREFSSLRSDWMRSVELRDRIGEIVAGPDFPDLSPDLQGGLDLLHVELVALTRENVCTNERCPRANYTTSNDSPIGLNPAVSWRLSFDLISSNRRIVSRD